MRKPMRKKPQRSKARAQARASAPTPAPGPLSPGASAPVSQAPAPTLAPSPAPGARGASAPVSQAPAPRPEPKKWVDLRLIEGAPAELKLELDRLRAELQYAVRIWVDGHIEYQTQMIRAIKADTLVLDGGGRFDPRYHMIVAIGGDPEYRPVEVTIVDRDQIYKGPIFTALLRRAVIQDRGPKYIQNLVQVLMGLVSLIQNIKTVHRPLGEFATKHAQYIDPSTNPRV